MRSAYSVQYQNVRKTWILIFFFVALVTSGFYFLGWFYDSYWLAIVGLGLSLGQSLIGYFFGDKFALMFAQAEPADPTKYSQIHVLVENLAKIAGIPKPKIYISPDPSANAFACGRDPEHASICLNQGILEILNKNELEGVIAHEIAHIKNRDTLVMTVTMVLSSLVAFIADIGARLALFGGEDKEAAKKSPILLVLYILFLILAPIISLLIQLAVSRSREYLADATAVVLTRYPQGLIGALEKISNYPVPTANYSTAMNHFYIIEPKQNFGEMVESWFSTHPPVADRIAKLRQMA